MARIRQIKPDYWTDEKIVKLDFSERLAFIGLWNFVDDEGRCEYKPLSLKMKIFPADEIDMVVILKHLHLSGLVAIYPDNEHKYIQVNNFRKHQTDLRYNSKIPKPENVGTCSDLSPLVGTCSDLSPNLINLINPINLKDNEQKEKKIISGYTENFESIWKEYPNRDGKKSAFQAYKKTVKNENDFNNLKKAISNYKQNPKVKEGFIKNGSTFFNNWQDWIFPTPEMMSGVKKDKTTYDKQIEAKENQRREMDEFYNKNKGAKNEERKN